MKPRLKPSIVIMTSPTYGARTPPFSRWRHSHCDVILWSAPLRTCGHLTAFNNFVLFY